MKLSILIFTYNQIELLKNNISNVIRSRSQDIEIIVSDNCSTEPIEEMLLSFNDTRIKYCKTPEHGYMEHNILNGIKNCKGDYIYVFRTKDYVIGEKIDDVINVINANYGAAYFVFSCIDENGNKRLFFQDKVYHKGDEAKRILFSQETMTTHPSGYLFNRSMIDIEKYEAHITNNPSFLDSISQLIKIDLCRKGDFITSTCYAWVYTYTEKSQHKSVLDVDTPMGISPYNPVYQYEVYESLWIYIIANMIEFEKVFFIKSIIYNYLNGILLGFYLINKNKEVHAHYNCMQIKYSPYKEALTFYKKTKLLINNSDFNSKKTIEFFGSSGITVGENHPHAQ